MKLGKLAFAYSIAMAGGFLIREVLKVRIRLSTMAMRYSILQSLPEDEGFVALHFNPFYDNRTLARDLVLLEAYLEPKDKSKPTMPRVPLEAVNRSDAYANETDYSAYELTKENIKTICDCFGNNPDIKYVLFVPEPYRNDKRYFAYRIMPADVAKRELPVRGRVAVRAHALTTAENNDEGEPSAGSEMLFSSMMMRTGVLLMNPSPPASSSLASLGI